MNYKALEVEFISRKNANDTSNNGMNIEHGNARIKRTVSDLRKSETVLLILALPRSMYIPLLLVSLAFFLLINSTSNAL